VIRRLRGLPAIDVPRGYQWSLRLVQLAIALMFAGAVFHKVLHGQGRCAGRSPTICGFPAGAPTSPGSSAPMVDWLLAGSGDTARPRC
jgi:hypothetical protein